MMNSWNSAISDVIGEYLNDDRLSRLFLSAATPRCDVENFEASFGLTRIFRLHMTPASLTGVAAGAARAGARTIVELSEHASVTQTIAHLTDHIANAQYYSADRIKLPIFIRAVVGQVNQFVDELAIANVPGLCVAAPSNLRDATIMTRNGLHSDHPVLLLEQQSLVERDVPQHTASQSDDPMGSARVRRAGGDVTILAVAGDVPCALLAAEILDTDGVSAEVIDLRYLAPLDVPTMLTSVHKTGRVLIVDHPMATGGWSSELAARLSALAFDYLDGPILRQSDFQSTLEPLSPELLADAAHRALRQ